MAEIAENDYSLNISRYVSTAPPEVQIELDALPQNLVSIEKTRARRRTSTMNF